MSRILYFCPDFPQPSGGIKTLYRHVQTLAEMGFDAWIVHQKAPFRVTWHGYEAPTLWLSERPRFAPQDILVIPEVMPQVMQQTARFSGERIVICPKLVSHLLEPAPRADVVQFRHSPRPD